MDEVSKQKRNKVHKKVIKVLKSDWDCKKIVS